MFSLIVLDEIVAELGGDVAGYPKKNEDTHEGTEKKKGKFVHHAPSYQHTSI